MTADGPALLRAVIANPDDDDRRLVYADFLQAQGDPQGELIAVQVRLARLAADAPERGELETHAKALLDAHAATWNARLGDQLSHVTYRRGLAYAARAPLRHGLLELLDRAPIRDLGLTGGDDDDAELLAIARELAGDQRLDRIELLATDVPWGEAAFGALFGSEHLTSLRALQVADEDCQVYAGRALAAAHLPALEMLALCGDYAATMGDAGVVALAGAKLPALRDLALLNLQCTGDSAQALAASATLTQLHSLDFGWGSYNANRIGPQGAAAIGTSDNFSELRRLVLDFNAIGDLGVAALATSPSLGSLRTLSVKSCELGDPALRVLASASGLPQLETLELTFNRAVTAAGVTALAGSHRLATITSLWLRQIDLGPDAARAIADSPHAKNLRNLNLLECNLGDAGARALLESPHLDNLVELQLNGNKISDDIRTALRARWGAAVRADR